MTELKQLQALEARVNAGLDRLAAAWDARPAPEPVEDPRMAELEAAIDAARTALEERDVRIAALATRAEEAESARANIKAQLDKQRAVAQRLDADHARLTRLNDALMEVSASLRTAALEAVSEPHLINKAMMTEMEALRMRSQVDRDEGAAILAALEPLMAEAEAAATDEDEATAGEGA